MLLLYLKYCKKVNIVKHEKLNQPYEQADLIYKHEVLCVVKHAELFVKYAEFYIIKQV